MSTEIKNARKTAKLLDAFNMVDCAQAEVVVYLRDNSAKRIVSRSTNVTPEMARYWKYSDWLYFVESAEEHYRNISRLLLDEVVSVVIHFKIAPSSLSIYSVENTNLSEIDGFDRFLSSTPRTGKNYEIFFETEDRTKIKSTYDVLGIAVARGVENLRPVASDLPYICLHGNDS